MPLVEPSAVPQPYLKDYTTWTPSTADLLAYGIEGMDFKFAIPDLSVDPPVRKSSDAKVGVNVFMDLLPKQYWDQDGNYKIAPEDNFFLIQTEPVATLAINSSRSGRDQTVLRVSCLGGRRDFAHQNLYRLYHLFSQPENVQSWSVCGKTARVVRALGEPSLVGTDDTGFAQYAFRVEIQTVDGTIGSPQDRTT